MLAARSLHNRTETTWVKQSDFSRHTTRPVSGHKASSERLKWIGTILLCTAVLSGIIGQFSEIARTNIEVERLKIQIEAQMEKNAKLNDRVNELSSPARIISKAREMGMVSTNPGALAVAPKE
ncbi:septum formation initiator family protein [Effusibacillus lacus]|uniref:Cell division protein FtsL n=1 Tax=Effusibacillus lacus TaxID=1348429 RepID=A0A292YQI7_9BACL|nr:septum formation initiator family protein [Effusibacillus lacus]TCS75693.1 cell division protein FtsL [Effusibacillus lacus]GAX91013.1 cell division protein FtsL [Effusibacillus lacus]